MLRIYKQVLKKYVNKYFDAKNIIQTYMFTWPVGGRWYTSNLHVAFCPPWHQGLCPGIEETTVTCPYIDICCKLIAGQVVRKRTKELNIIGPHITDQIDNWLLQYGWEFKDFLSSSPSLTLDVFHRFAPHMKVQVAIVTGGDVKQAVSS